MLDWIYDFEGRKNDTVSKSVSELSIKKDQPCLASPDKFVILGVQIKNYNLCYLQRNKFLSKCASMHRRKMVFMT